MSIVTAVKKGNTICIAADTLSKHGSTKVRAKHKLKYHDFWASGSGQEFALGAMHSLYPKRNLTARAIAEAGVRAACEYDDGCDLPLECRSLRLK